MNTNQICSICERQPEDLLVLACQHNLCVSCASEIFILNQQRNPFICEICLAQTLLDEETIACFQSQTQKYTQKKLRQSKKKSKPPKAKSPVKKKEISSVCSIHNEPAIYYCFNCNANDICSECILTSKHTNHKVLTLKKATSEISQKLQQEIKKNNQIKNKLQQQKRALMRQKKNLRSEYQIKKTNLKQIFNQLASIISQKYSDLCESMENQCINSQKIYEGVIGEIEQKQKLLQESIQSQLDISNGKFQYGLSEAIESLNINKNIYYPSIPKEMPFCFRQLGTVEVLVERIKQDLRKFEWSLKQNQTILVEYSDIKQQNLDQIRERTALKQSQKRDLNMSKTNNRMGSSFRKLDLSRSIQNASYIINRLKERSRDI